MDAVSLQQVIRQYINLPNQTSGTGWYPILCKICGDSGRKGPRAGFKFDGNKTAYHCFNCGHATVFDADTNHTVPEKMVQVLNAYGVPEDQWKVVLLKTLENRDKGIRFQPGESQVTPIEPMAIPVPENFYELSEASPNDKWAEIARTYLEHDRGVLPGSHQFYLAVKTGDPKLDRWCKRIIVPIHKDNKLIFYFGRDLTGKAQKKYLSPSYSREKVIYGFDELFRQTEENLYIVEGWFDAVTIGGVALLGNEISEPQAIWLNKSYRKKVYIPDRLGDGWVAAEDALQRGWSVSTPDIGNCKDINEAVMKYGKLYVMKSIADNIADGFTAQTKLGIYCNYDTLNKNRSKKKDSSAPKAKRANI